MPKTVQTGIRFFQGTTAPNNFNMGDEWYNTETGKIYKFMSINGTAQWYELPTFSSVSATSWTTATRPTNPSTNTLGYNRDINKLEFYRPGGWFAI